MHTAAFGVATVQPDVSYTKPIPVIPGVTTTPTGGAVVTSPPTGTLPGPTVGPTPPVIGPGVAPIVTPPPPSAPPLVLEEPLGPLPGVAPARAGLPWVWIGVAAVGVGAVWWWARRRGRGRTA